MHFLLQVIAGGLAAGAIYGLVAVGYSLTWMTARVFNFALGMWVMLGGMLTYTFHSRLGLPALVSLPLVILLLFGFGWVAEKISVQPFLRAGSDLWVMSTMAVGFLLIDFAELIWGRGQNEVAPYVSATPLRLGTVHLAPQQVLIIGAAIGIYLALEYFYRNTLAGKAFRAVAQNREVSGLMGINTRRIESYSYALSAALAGIAGFLIVPITGAEAQLGTGIGFKAFAVAIIAGLAAPRGIAAFGFIYGVFESLVSGYLHNGLRDILGFSLMIVSLYFFPSGLFGAREEERL